VFSLFDKSLVTAA